MERNLRDLNIVSEMGSVLELKSENCTVQISKCLSVADKQNKQIDETILEFILCLIDILGHSSFYNCRKANSSHLGNRFRRIREYKMLLYYHCLMLKNKKGV